MNKESYNAIAASWDEARRLFAPREREYLDAFLEGMAVPSHILDLGCGTGRPIAEYVLARGHALTGVDQAEKPLALARGRFPQAKWIESRIQDFEPARAFDGIICWDTLFHIDRAEHETLIGRMSRMLVPEGRLVMTVGGTEHPAFTDTMFGHEFFYDSHPPARVVELIGACGLFLLVAGFINAPEPGRDKGRYVIVASRPRTADAAS